MLWELDDRTKDMIDELKVESLRREELERKITEVSERTKKRASNMMRMARKNHAEMKRNVDRTRSVGRCGDGEIGVGERVERVRRGSRQVREHQDLERVDE